MKAVEKLNDVQTGLIGTANTLTKVAKSTFFSLICVLFGTQ